MICAYQIQPRKHALDHAVGTALARQHELDPTDHTDQGCVIPKSSTLVHYDL